MNKTTNTWINPIAVIKVFTENVLYRSSKGEDLTTIINDRTFKRTAEAWPAAMQVLARQQNNPEIKFFIQENPNRSDAPDFYSLWLHKDGELTKGYIREIEVFRYNSESKLSFEDELKKKIDKGYSKDTDLVCQVTRKGFRKTTGEISKIVRALNPKNDVWIIGANEVKNVSISQVYPSIGLTVIDVRGTLKTIFSDENPPFLKRIPVTSLDQIKGPIKFEKLGRQVLLTSELNLLDYNSGVETKE